MKEFVLILVMGVPPQASTVGRFALAAECEAAGILLVHRQYFEGPDGKISGWQQTGEFHCIEVLKETK